MIAKIKQFDRRDVCILHRFARRLWTVFAGYVKRVMEFNREVRRGRPFAAYSFNSICIPSKAGSTFGGSARRSVS